MNDPTLGAFNAMTFNGPISPEPSLFVIGGLYSVVFNDDGDPFGIDPDAVTLLN